MTPSIDDAINELTDELIFVIERHINPDCHKITAERRWHRHL
jgi:hypothetical protein